MAEGKHIIEPDDDEVKEFIHTCKRSIIFYVVGFEPTIEAVYRFIALTWSSIAEPTVYWHESGYFVIHCRTEEECEIILSQGPYMMGRRPVVVKQWSTNFDLKEEHVRVITLWVRFPNLPLHYWWPKTLDRIVSAIGTPICADECTSSQKRVSFARVLLWMLMLLSRESRRLILQGEMVLTFNNKYILNGFHTSV